MADPRADASVGDIDLGLILQHARDAITVQGADGRLVYANGAAAELMGFPDAAALLGAPLASVMASYELLDEGGNALQLDQLPGRRALEGEEAPEALIHFIDRARGIERWSLVRSVAIQNEASARYVVNAFQDVTKLKQREVSLRVLADAADVLGRSSDYGETLQDLADTVVPELADWCVVDVLDAGRTNRVAVAHADAAKVALANELQMRYPPDPNSPISPAAVARSGEPVLIERVTDDIVAQNAQDDEHLERMRALGIRSAVILPLVARGNVLGAMSLVRAETPRSYSSDDLPLLLELARRAALAVDNARLMHETTQALRLRDEFLATLSHDMRTPLATILGYLQISQRQIGRLEGAERVGEFLERAERTTVRMAHFVSELMDVSLITAGQPIPLVTEAVDLNAIVERSLNEHRQLDGTHELVLDRSREPAIALTDPARVERILENLLSNAIKFSPEGSTVRISVEATPDEAAVKVTDEGVGIPAGELALIFQRFHRAATAKGAPGVGLGLSGAREVARRMGGDLTAESEEGRGSTFTLRIPTQPPGDAVPEGESAASA
ncbi:MAG TPA: PAS domain-containing sensor histidine kinase [Candidatus Limnocylindria bacterium]|nr:PAS domain-containing sensor histidine kinase [Candidatus Limnocylindria bacterium]